MGLRGTVRLVVVRGRTVPTSVFTQLFQAGLLLRAGPFLNPKYVFVLRLEDRIQKRPAVSSRQCESAGVFPLFDFRMAIRKGESAASGMVGGRTILPQSCRPLGVHSDSERPIIDAVGILIDKNP